MSLSFMSADWCEAAKDACNASQAMYDGFKDPSTWTNKMAFATQDRELACHWEWLEGKVVSCTPPKFDESDLWLIIAADLATWREAAEGKREGGQLLIAGKIKFVKGPISSAIENGAALNAFLRAWGEIETDWNV